MQTSVSPDVIARSHANFIECLRALARVMPGSVIEEFDGVVCIATSVRHPLFNPAFVRRVPDDPALAVSRAVTFHARHDRPWLLRVVPEAKGAIEPAAEAAGLKPGPPMPGMVLPELSRAPNNVDGLTVEIVRDEATLHVYMDAFAAGYGMPRAMVTALDRPELLEAPDFTYYLGYVDGETVATAMRFTSHRIAGVFNISTIPSHRRRGLGEAMTWRAALDGRDEGCVASYLQATAMGYPIYKRMGYEHALTYPSWQLPPGPAA